MITIDGVTLTTEEAREVLAWVDDPLRPVPTLVYFRGSTVSPTVPHIGRYTAEDRPLTEALIEQLRDHCFPWREARRDEVKPGTRVRVEGDPRGRVYEGVMTDERIDDAGNIHVAAPAGSRIVVKDDGFTEHVPHYATVLVRRPREAGIRLRDVKPGQAFEAGAMWAKCRRTLTGYVREIDWSHWVPYADDCGLNWDDIVKILEDE